VIEMAEAPKKSKEYPDTPSGNALKEVGNLDGEDVKEDGYEAANAHGEKYQAAKRKHRWG
jgi:hypothetical protein